MNKVNVYKYYFIRELKEKYIGNLIGVSWVLIQPIILLTIYWFIFEKIFHTVVPEAKSVGFIVYLAIGFWPWIAFSESVIQAITAVTKNAALIGKNKIDFKIPVIATISATFLLNLISYVMILIVLMFFYDLFSFYSVLILIIPVSQAFMLSLSLGLFLSATQVFIKDTLQFFVTLMTLWFFITPIIYSETLIPEAYLPYMKLNPMYTIISFIHKAIITHDSLPWSDMLYIFILNIILLILAIKYFNKLSNHFEDYK